MDHNEICMFLDVKLDIHDKRALALRLKTWTRCQVKIEAIKCVPCFLRFTFQAPATEELCEQKPLSVSVNVPGLSISLASSRTKQYSYGLFWTQNRRDCFIYFALETEISCRRHMKWVKKSIKNLELYRQVFLEQRRLSRGPSVPRVLGPLPTLPDSLDASTFSSRTSRVSQIYEEIFDGSRISRASIASGIYEEMKPSPTALLEAPPAVPPLPTHRKRINTFERPQPNAGLLGDIPRSSTTPESELAKKKKYKNMLDNIFGSNRQKRSSSISEATTNQKSETAKQPSVHDLVSCDKSIALQSVGHIAKSQRNSFSSPDLSKLNFLDTFGEPQMADLLQMNSDDSNGELNISLDDSAILPSTRNLLLAKISQQLSKVGSGESLNVSEQLSHNFNFSACNTSTMNLIGANGAVPTANVQGQKNKIILDDLTGYCVMAPIIKKNIIPHEQQQPPAAVGCGSTSSGYSTGSYCSSTSSCNTEEQQQQSKTLVPAHITAPITAPTNESDIYEPMHARSLNNSDTADSANSGFAEHLYENLLAVKAAQELQMPLSYGISTSTPTESPLLPALPQKGTPKQQVQTSTDQQEEEDYYQTPRRSIISIDDKIPSYYPNSCDTLKSKRRSLNSTDSSSSTSFKHLVSAKLRRERKENLYISSPQQIIEQRQKQPPRCTPSPSSSSSLKTKTQTKKTAAHKISEGVYAVTHVVSKRPHSNTNNVNNNNNNNDVNNLSSDMQQKLQEELLQLAMLQNIDFKFDDSKSPERKIQLAARESPSKAQSQQPTIVQPKIEEEYEHCYQAAERATRLLQRYATLAKFGNSPTKSPQLQQQVKQHQLQTNQTANIKAQEVAITMTQSVASSMELQSTGGGMKKFASLPRFKKIDFSPLRMRLNNVLQRHQAAVSSAPSTPEQQ